MVIRGVRASNQIFALFLLVFTPILKCLHYRYFQKGVSVFAFLINFIYYDRPFLEAMAV